jgi:ABC-type uncharacterized transport system involved in gliding motility auxiliary subunit
MKKFNLSTIMDGLKSIVSGGARGTAGALGSRQARFGGNALLTGIVFCAILVVINLIFKNAGLRWDLTKNKSYSLSDETVKVIKGIKDPVQVYAFFTSDPRSAEQKEQARKLMEEYTIRNPQFKYEFIDPRRNQALAVQYGINKDGTIVLTQGPNKEQTIIVTEEALTTALIKLANPEKVYVTFWSGQGERDIDGTDDFGYSELKSELEKLNYVVSKQDSNRDPQVASNTGVLVIAGSQSTYVQKQIDALSAYLKRGGKVLVMLDVMKDNRKSGLEDLLSQYGVSVNYGYVIDGEYKNPFITVENYESSVITKSITPSLFVGALEVKPSDKKPDNATIESLVKSPTNSWLEVSPLSASQEPKKENNDTSGPISMGVAVSYVAPEDKKDSPEYKTRMVVLGDADLGSNLVTQYQEGKQFFAPGNTELLLNSVNWLTARENLINIAPKDQTKPTLTVTDSQVGQIRNLVLYIMPGTVLLIGYLVWRARKNLKTK